MWAEGRLISSEYLAQQRHMHQQGIYGDSGKKWAKTVAALAKQYDCKTVLDYGCGVAGIKDRLNGTLEVSEYDPAIPGKDAHPYPADLVACVDVLEHIEPRFLGGVLDNIRAITQRVAFFVIATRAAGKTLPDGRNAHLIIKDPEWWKLQMLGRFNLLSQINHSEVEWRVVLEPIHG